VQRVSKPNASVRRQILLKFDHYVFYTTAVLTRFFRQRALRHIRIATGTSGSCSWLRLPKRIPSL
jgi:hypothetical protein